MCRYGEITMLTAMAGVSCGQQSRRSSDKGAIGSRRCRRRVSRIGMRPRKKDSCEMKTNARDLERGLVELARHPAGFVLYERPSLSSPPWRTLKLQREPRVAGRKNNWNLGWN